MERSIGELERAVLESSVLLEHLKLGAQRKASESRRPDGTSVGRSTHCNPDHGRRGPLPITAVKLPRYSGLTPLEPYLAQVELAALHGGWSGEETATHLEGPALQVLADLLPEDRRELQAITAALQRHFVQRTSVEQSREQLAGRYRHDGESLGAFAADVQLYTQRGYPTFPVAAREELSLHSFLRGLAPERLRQHVRLSTPRSLEEALREAERAEEVLGAGSAPGRSPSWHRPVRAASREAAGERLEGEQYLVGAPMERVGVDILGPFPTTEAGNRYILVAMDYFTKWPEAYAVPDQTATTAAQRLVEDMFSRFGVPEELHSDQGRNFESQLFAEVCQRLGVRKTRTTPLHPQSDGLVERFNRTLATQLAILTSRHQKDWDQHLPLVLWAYRTAVQESSQCTPATLMFGRELRTPVDLVFGPPPEPEITGGPELDYLRRLKERLSVVHQLARESQGDAGARQKRAYDGRCHGHPFSVGDNVWVYCPVRKRGLSPKLTSHWKGPGEILDRISEVVYRVRMPGRRRRVVLHRDRLAPYHPLAPNPVTEPEDSLLSATPSASMNNGGLGAEPGAVSGPLQRPARARRLPGQLRDFVVGLSD
ncbi:hypothetical protein Q8A73_013065 [Channa argus]|nr:hypothetical protein Q8A73_013065 [Channa argus]